jgi:hypothetical protein
MHHVKWIIVGLAAIFWWSCVDRGSTTAQDLDNVVIAGSVTDENGAVIPGATVSAIPPGTRLERTAAAGNLHRQGLVHRLCS